MTGDEMERAIDFLLQGQANHEARLGALTERVGELTGTVNQLSETVNQLTEQVAGTNRLMQFHAETQTNFIQIVTRHIETQVEINASLRASIKQGEVKISQADVKIKQADAKIKQAEMRINQEGVRLNQADAKITRTDTRLDRLEALVERYIEGRSNGQG
jgi:chromosome segregation ATPase